jgi:hypothetical protein
LRKIIAVLLWLAFLSLTGRDSKAGNLAVSERSWNFGNVPPRGKVTHGFVIKNTGRDSRRLIKVRTTCSCTTAPLKKRVLAPGDTARLEVTFHTGSFSGPVSRVLYLRSDDPAEPMLELGVSVTVGYRGRQLEFEPLQADFDTVQTLPARAVLKMKNRDSVPVSPALLEAPAGLQVIVPAEPVAPGGEVSIGVVWKTPPVGDFHASFSLVCNDSQKSRYTIPVRGYYRSVR